MPAVGQASLHASHGPSITAISEPYELPRAQRLPWEEATRVAEPVAQTMRPRKMNYEIHGNTIPHLHMHLFPRFDGDPFEGGPIHAARVKFSRTAAEGQTVASAIKGYQQS